MRIRVLLIVPLILAYYFKKVVGPRWTYIVIDVLIRIEDAVTALRELS